MRTDKKRLPSLSLKSQDLSHDRRQVGGIFSGLVGYKLASSLVPDIIFITFSMFSHIFQSVFEGSLKRSVESLLKQLRTVLSQSPLYGVPTIAAYQSHLYTFRKITLIRNSGLKSLGQALVTCIF